MSEQLKPEKYLKGPRHLARCAMELTGMYAMEQLRSATDAIDDALDVDFGDRDDSS